MALMLKKWYQGYLWIVNDLADPRSKDFLLMGPITPWLISFAYLYFIKNLGPKFMQNRQPFEIKNLLKVYNLFQIAANFYILCGVIDQLRVTNWTCAVVDFSNTPEALRVLHFGYCFYLLKILDLFDTVFFVLRKSYRQVSFLHVYHHCGMVVGMWIGVKFLPGGNSIWLPALNCFVHMMMFTYYFLTAVSEKWKNNLTLKKALTQLQLVQFMTMIFLYGRIFFQPDCKYPVFISYVFIPQNAFMILMFGDFYLKTYVFKKKGESPSKKT